MRRFRAIVQTPVEPEDHEVIWQWKGRLLYWNNNGWEPLHTLDTSEILYESGEDKDVKTVKQALDKLLYVPLDGTFSARQKKVYERGTVVNSLDLYWSYNKDIKAQEIQNVLGWTPVPITERSLHLDQSITRDTTFRLRANDGKTSMTKDVSINFVEYVYYGTLGGVLSRKDKVKPDVDSISITARDGQYIWIFIPYSANYIKIWCNGVDSTDSFESASLIYHTDTGQDVRGVYYTSKHPGLGSVTLEFTGYAKIPQ